MEEKMPGILIRALIAVIGCILAYKIIPPVGRLIHFPIEGDLLTVVTVVIIGIALFYIIRGTNWPWSKT
jgi:hypothetical protein